MPVRSADWIERFLEAEKVVSRGVRWKTKNRADHAEASASVMLSSGSMRIRGKLVVVAHRALQPPKYGFSLIFGGTRVLGLDVNPNRSHRNILIGQSIAVTHWQRYPFMEAEPDERELTFSGWTAEFLKTAKITCKHRIAAPPFGIQLKLEFLPWNG